jgi:hypothetical protein
VPLLVPEAPLVGTGLEFKAGQDSGVVILAREDGVVEKVAGDEIIVSRAARIRTTPVSVKRYFAGEPNVYVEPFGGIVANLEHQQVALYNEKRVD